MLKVFSDTRKMDSSCREQYLLSEEIMMENAAAALEKEVMPHAFNEAGYYLNRASVLILAGKGNNGADGYALARRLADKKLAVTVCCFGEPSTEMCAVQKKRAEKLGVVFIDPMEVDEYINEKSFDLRVIVDCIFGSGFHGCLPADVEAVLDQVNALDDVYKVACDIPSGMNFYANVTVTMGALKTALFSDKAKDVAGKIVVADLGVSRRNFERFGEYEAVLLEESDLELPYRKKQNVNKGSFGHVAVVAGEKPGAAVIAGSAALKFGAGLVTIVTNSDLKNPYELMKSETFPENTNVVCFGMGCGRENINLLNDVDEFLSASKNVGLVLDADACYMANIKPLLEKRSRHGKPTVITPHPKEFAELLSLCDLGEYSTVEVVAKRMELVKKFCLAFPEIVLVLKGANVLVGVKRAMKKDCDIYINPLGTNALAKAGSGDVLAGLTAALMAQDKLAVEAAVNATLAHGIASGKFENNFALTPFELIEKVASL